MKLGRIKFYKKTAAVLLTAATLLHAPASFAASGGMSASFPNGAVIIGYNPNNCAAALSGAIRFSSSTSIMDFCNGTYWVPIVLSTQSLVTNCVTANKGALRYNTAGLLLSTGLTNRVEVCNGSSWIAVNPISVAAGATTQVQYNSGGELGASAGLTWTGGSNIIDATGGYQIRGTDVLKLTTSGNPILGQTAMSQSGDGHSVGVGRDALAAIVLDDVDAVAVGHEALKLNQSGSDPTAIGYQASSLGTNGYSVTATGYMAAYNFNSSGNDAGETTVVGSNAFKSATQTDSAVVIGSSASQSEVNPLFYLDVIGRRAGYTDTGSNQFVVFGADAVSATTSLSVNAVFGYGVLQSHTTNSGHAVIGSNAGSAATTGGSLILIGSGIQTVGSGTEAEINIGNVIYGNSNSRIMGVGSSNYTANFLATPPGAETITAAATITANACGTVKQITAAGTITTNTTNTFTAPAAANTGCCMDVINTGSNTITLDQNANFKTNGGTDKALAASNFIRVCSNGTAWYQIGPLSANN